MLCGEESQRIMPLEAERQLGLSLASVSTGTLRCEELPPPERPVLTAPSLGYVAWVVTGCTDMSVP